MSNRYRVIVGLLIAVLACAVEAESPPDYSKYDKATLRIVAERLYKRVQTLEAEVERLRMELAKAGNSGPVDEASESPDDMVEAGRAQWKSRRQAVHNFVREIGEVIRLRRKEGLDVAGHQSIQRRWQSELNRLNRQRDSYVPYVASFEVGAVGLLTTPARPPVFRAHLNRIHSMALGQETPPLSPVVVRVMEDGGVLMKRGTDTFVVTGIPIDGLASGAVYESDTPVRFTKSATVSINTYQSMTLLVGEPVGD